MPEGVTLNFLAGRNNPTPYLNFDPIMMQLLGEDRMLSALEDHPPDFVCWVPKDVSEYGMRGFGNDYATQLAAWLSRDFEVVWPNHQLTGNEIVLLRHQPPPPRH